MQSDPSSRRVTFVDMNMAGHASRSGYTQVSRTNDGASPARLITADGNVGPLSRALMSVSARWAKTSGNQWYNRRSLRAEWACATQMLTMRRSVIHFLYGENTYRYAGALRRSWPGRNSRLVATYHTPQKRFNELISNAKHIGKLDAVVIMSEVQRPIFAELLDNTRVHFIPHGVDTDYFRPAAEAEKPCNENSPRKNIRCITVGNHLRDYNSLATIAQKAARKNLDVEFVVVANPRLVTGLQGINNVQCLHGIDDAELLRLYQESDVLLLPLSDATANNTLLEGMACGLPVLASDLVGVRDYAPGTNALYARDADGMLEQIESICDQRHHLQAMATASRTRAEELSWDNIRTQLATLYEQL